MSKIKAQDDIIEEIQSLREELEEEREKRQDLEEKLEETTSETEVAIGRRGFLAALLGVGGVGLLSGSAQTARAASGQIGTDADPLVSLHTNGLNGAAISAGRAGEYMAMNSDGSMQMQTPQDVPVIAALDDTESYEIPVRVPDGSTLNIYGWGAYDVADGSAPTGLTVELLGGGDTVQASANTAYNSSATGTVASYTNSSGSPSVFKIRAKNGTGGALNSPGVGLIAEYEVV